jgi:hypothetical protein
MLRRSISVRIMTRWQPCLHKNEPVSELILNATAKQHFYTAGSDNLQESEQAYGVVCKLIM